MTGRTILFLIDTATDQVLQRFEGTVHTGINKSETYAWPKEAEEALEATPGTCLAVGLLFSATVGSERAA